MQALYAAESSEQEKVAGLIEDVKLNDADVATVLAGGFEVSVVSGARGFPNAWSGATSSARRPSSTSSSSSSAPA